MNKRRFFIQLLTMAALLIAMVLILQMFPVFKSSTGFSLLSIGFFFLMSVGMFFIAAKSAISKDKNAFTRMIMLFTLGKLLLTVVLVISYQMIVKPESVFFVIPFFSIYIAFTIFETVFMTKLGKIKVR